jgi:O-antigen/teichoic acid export membrane protein
LVVGLSVLALVAGYGIAGLIVAHLMGSIFELLFSGLVVIKRITKPELVVDYFVWKKLLRNAFPFAILGVFASIYFNIDVVMLSKMRGDEITGWYNAAYRLITALMFIPSAFIGSVAPVLNRFFVSSKNSMGLTYSKSFKYLFILALPLAVGSTLLADRIIGKIYGPEFIQAALALKVLIWGAAFMFLNNVTCSTMVSLGREKTVTNIVGLGIGLNVLLNILLIPPFGHVGASAATMVTEVWVLVITLYLLQKQFYKLSAIETVLRPSIATAVMALFILNLEFLRLYQLIFLGGALYFLSLFLIKGLSEEDFQLIKKAFKTRGR